MTLDDIVQRTIESQLNQADIEAFCKVKHTTTEAFCDEFARHVATGYVDRRLTYQAADTAMAALFFHFDHGIPGFARSIFECFDEAEYRRTKDSDPDEIALPLVRNLLDQRT